MAGIEPDPLVAEQELPAHTYGDRVARVDGPIWSGQVVPPTRADLARGVAELGSWMEIRVCVLVQWGYGQRSWEYVSDLRSI